MLMIQCPRPELGYQGEGDEMTEQAEEICSHTESTFLECVLFAGASPANMVHASGARLEGCPPVDRLGVKDMANLIGQ